MGKLEFKASFIPTLITILLLYILVSLGMWQLDRADEKTHLEQLVKQRSEQSAIQIDDAPRSKEDRMYLPVFVQGRFDTGHQILLDNQVFNHQAGYQVYTPLIREHGPLVLIDRGWIAQGNTRAELPDVSLSDPGAQETLQGVLMTPPAAPLVLADNVNNYQQWPAVSQFIDFSEVESALGQAVYPMVVKLDQNNRFALHQQAIRFNMTSDKHLGYAFQWFALALTLTIIYFVVNTKREKTANDG